MAWSAIIKWTEENCVERHHIAPGKQQENGSQEANRDSKGASS
jgi:hypothetical protein